MDNEFIEKTIQFWETYCPDSSITPDDAKSMVSGMSSFFEILNSWDEPGNELKSDLLDE